MRIVQSEYLEEEKYVETFSDVWNKADGCAKNKPKQRKHQALSAKTHLTINCFVPALKSVRRFPSQTVTKMHSRTQPCPSIMDRPLEMEIWGTKWVNNCLRQLTWLREVPFILYLRHHSLLSPLFKQKYKKKSQKCIRLYFY